MKKISSTIVFFGSGPVALESLRLLAQDFTIETVITKPATREEMSKAAKATPVFAVNTKKELDELVSEKRFKSRIGILIDFGIIVSQQVIDSFPLGIINSHFSLLPQWRGADPITFSILSGQKKTGVSLMLLTAGMDEGPLLAQSVYDLEDQVTTPVLTHDLIELSYGMLKHAIPLYLENKVEPAPQTAVTLAESSTPTYSRKLTKSDGVLDWSKPAEQLEREVRAFLEWPKSRTVIADKDVIITKATVLPLEGNPGDVAVVENTIVVFCAKDALRIDRLKPASKAEMDARAFLAGYKIS